MGDVVEVTVNRAEGAPDPVPNRALRGHRLHLTAFPRLRRGIAELGTRASSAEQDQWRARFARDSALEGDGFELPVPRKLGLRRGGVLRSTWAVLTLRRRDPDWSQYRVRRVRFAADSPL